MPKNMDPATGEVTTSAQAAPLEATEPAVTLADAESEGPAFNRGFVVEGFGFRRKKASWVQDGNEVTSYLEEVYPLTGALAGKTIGILDASGFTLLTVIDETTPAV